MDTRLTVAYSPSTTARLIMSLFAGALFTSAGLLFWVQPLIAKMLLPSLGGAPSVWNTCMVFFQSLLLAGYAYVLIVSRWKLKTQILLHLTLLVGAGSLLPFSINEGLLSQLPTQSDPTFWLLKVLLITVGFPFFLLSATAPLLQRWFSHSSHASAKDPYFLYAVSNAGSMLSLLAFPFLLEPRWPLGTQAKFWSGGYLLLALLMGLCALLVGRETHKETSWSNERERITSRMRLEWVLAAFIPSSLMLGVTTHISTDVAAMPLVWIIPLALYLLTFILAFAKKQILNLKLATYLAPAMLIGLAFIVAVRPLISVWIVIGLHLSLFFLIAFACHRRLAQARPSINKLPEYYLFISIGGVLGGLFNALLAPLIFSTPLEYPLILIAAHLLLPGGRTWSRSWLKLAFPVFVGALTIGLASLISSLQLGRNLGVTLVVGVPLLFSYFGASRQRTAFALSLLAIMAGSYSFLSAQESSLTTQRNFFGVWRVARDGKGTFHRLIHGSTTHGGQFTDAEKRCFATAYFHKDGPIGQVFATLNADPSFKHVAVVGLGAGTLSSYSESHQKWDFYEIDPAIVQIARDSRYFTYLSECSKVTPTVILGDARLKLREAPEQHYDLLLIDAFSSDSIPSHLVTLQAMDLYLSKLRPEGLLAVHISNRYLDLEPLISGLAKEKGMHARIRRDDETVIATAKYSSVWVVMSQHERGLGEILSDSRWTTLRGSAIWTDEFSNILELMR